MNRPLMLLMSVCLLFGASAVADVGAFGRPLGPAWGDGYHARSALGFAALPTGAAVEIEAIFEIKE